MKEKIRNIIIRQCPKLIITYWYWRTCGHLLNWRHPRDINEKIQWLKFNTDTTLWSLYSDKLAVREHIAEMGLADMLVPLYGSWQKAEDIDWEQLPNSFVMKTNHGSGDVLICKDKNTLNTQEATRHMAKALSEPFGMKFAEPHYDRIKPCIIAEQLLDANQQSGRSTSLIDYKIWAFDGKPAYILACSDRSKDKLSIGVYDLDWNFHPEYCKADLHNIPTMTPLPRPVTLKRMINAAALLSQGFPELRADFYEVNGHAYFGEMTFTAAAGLYNCYSYKLLNILGDLTDLTPYSCR